MNREKPTPLKVDEAGRIPLPDLADRINYLVDAAIPLQPVTIEALVSTGPCSLELQEHHGAQVWTDVETDALRRDRSLCYACHHYKPGEADHCVIATGLYEFCKGGLIAAMVTRCKHFVPNEADDG